MKISYYLKPKIKKAKWNEWSRDSGEAKYSDVKTSFRNLLTNKIAVAVQNQRKEKKSNTRSAGTAPKLSILRIALDKFRKVIWCKTNWVSNSSHVECFVAKMVSYVISRVIMWVYWRGNFDIIFFHNTRQFCFVRFLQARFRNSVSRLFIVQGYEDEECPRIRKCFLSFRPNLDGISINR